MKASSSLTRSLSVAAALVLAVPAPPAPAADPPPKSLAGLSKDQIKALPDNQPAVIGGKTLTRAQVRTEVQKGHLQLRSDIQGVASQKLQSFEQMKARNLSTQNEKARAMKASALAEAGKLASAVPTPTPKAPSGPPPDPKLTSVGAAYLMPGGGFMVAGSALGSQAGTAKLEWMSQSGGLNLFVELWKDNLAVLTVPDNLSGVYRQTARLTLTRKDGKATNTMTVPFEPLTDVKLLPSADTIVVCSDGADINDCEKLPNQTFEGSHANTFDVSADHGQDKFKVNLKNGWVVDSWDFHGKGWSMIGQDPRFHLSGISAGASTFDILVDFTVHPASDSWYVGLVYIRGPVGISHK